MQDLPGFESHLMKSLAAQPLKAHEEVAGD